MGSTVNQSFGKTYHTPPKTNTILENPPFEDVSPIKNTVIFPFDMLVQGCMCNVNSEMWNWFGWKDKNQKSASSSPLGQKGVSPSFVWLVATRMTSPVLPEKKKTLPSHGSSWNICLETSWKNLQGTLKNHLFLKGKTSSKQTMFGFYLKFPGCKLYLCSQLLHMNFAGNHEKLHQIKNLLVELFPPSVFSSTYIIADSWTINGWQTLLGCPWYLVTGL